MTTNIYRPDGLSKKGATYLLSLSLLLFTLTLFPRLGLAIYTYGQGNIDVQRYQIAGTLVLNGGTGYDLGLVYYPYPPPWMYIEALGVMLSKNWNISFDFLIKLPGIMADGVISIIVFFSLLRLQMRKQSAFTWSLAFAFNPISIMVTAGHGQFDSLVIVTCFCALYLIVFHDLQLIIVVVSALLLGAGIALKLFPILFVPVFVFYFYQRRLPFKYIFSFLLLTVLPLFLSIIPFIPNKLVAIIYPILYPLSREITDFGLGKILTDLGISNSLIMIGLRGVFVFVYFGLISRVNTSAQKLVVITIAILPYSIVILPRFQLNISFGYFLLRLLGAAIE